MAKPPASDGVAPPRKHEMEMVAIDKVSAILDSLTPLQAKRVLEFVITAQQERLMEAAQRAQRGMPG